MKKLMVIFVVLTLLCSGCSNLEKVKTDKLNIVCTVFPQYDFVREIAKDKVDLTLLIPPGCEAHSYEPSANNIISINDAELFIGIGGESETWAKHLVKNTDSDKLKQLYLIDCVDGFAEEFSKGMEKNSHSHHSHNHDEAIDEHVWTSPDNAAKICKIICDTLCSLDADNANYYVQNFNSYKEKLDKLNSDLVNATKNTKRDTVVFGDRFPLRYLTEAYGLTYYAAFPGCSSKTEPSAKTIAFLSDIVSENKIPAVFYMDYSDGRIANSIARESDAKAIRLYSCHNLSKKDFENGENYLSLMTKNAKALKEALN